MFVDWKLLLLLVIVRSGGTLSEQQQRGSPWIYPNTVSGRQHRHQHPKMVVDNTTRKCIFEVPTVILKAYPYARVLRVGSSMHMSVIETCCAGYQAHKQHGVAGGTVCMPVCESCLNGHCTEPNVCECFDGFVKNDNGDCVFTCPISCLNGQCYLDGTCKCHPGFKLDETKMFCPPICSGGCDGYKQNCTAPEECACQTGYTLKENGCSPLCQLDCGLGGTCVEPNICACGSEYTLRNGVCNAECYQKCENGICLSRNRCVCFKGFKFHERTKTCIPV